MLYPGFCDIRFLKDRGGNKYIYQNYLQCQINSQLPEAEKGQAVTAGTKFGLVYPRLDSWTESGIDFWYVSIDL